MFILGRAALPSTPAASYAAAVTPTAPPPTAPAANTARPATVTAAYALQLALTATLVVIIALAIADAVLYDGLIDQAARATGAGRDDVDGERASNVFGTLMIALPALLLAGWLGVTGWWVRRGSNVARILTLVALGAPLILGLVACVVGSLGGLLLAGLLLAPSGEPFPEEAEGDFTGLTEGGFYDELWRLDSNGWSAVSDALGLTASATALILGISVAVLLLTSASSRYFRPQHPAPALPLPVYPPYWQLPGGQYPPPRR